jgi:hypothetical protein
VSARGMPWARGTGDRLASVALPCTAVDSWCRRAAGLSQTYKRILFDNDEVLGQCREVENKTIKYWTACTEKMAPPTEEGAEEVPKAEGLEQYAGDPMPHLLIYLKGDLKATIDVRFLACLAGC